MEKNNYKGNILLLLSKVPILNPVLNEALNNDIHIENFFCFAITSSEKIFLKEKGKHKGQYLYNL